MHSKELQPTEYPDYFKKYLNLVEDANVLESLQKSNAEFIALVENIPGDRFDYTYEQGKWSIREVIQHLIDSELVFQYRSLTFARNPGANLEGFDHNVFAKNAKLSLGNAVQLINHFNVIRQSSIQLFQHFSDLELKSCGILNGQSTSVRALGFLICGHQIHHMEIIKQRYL